MAEHHSLQSLSSPHLLTNPLKRFFSGTLGADFSELKSRFPEAWDVYVMGGLLRNLLLDSSRKLNLANPDIDVVVSGASSRAELLESISNFPAGTRSRNSFGGVKYRGRLTDLTIDVWRIEDQAGIATTPRPHSVEQLLQHNLLDVDAVAWDCRTDALYEYGCFEAIRRAQIDLLPQGIDLRFMPEQVAHLLIVAVKTGFTLSDAAQSFVRRESRLPRQRDEIVQTFQRKAPQLIDRLITSLRQLTEGELVT